jgi:hypothetical protein
MSSKVAQSCYEYPMTIASSLAGMQTNGLIPKEGRYVSPRVIPRQEVLSPLLIVYQYLCVASVLSGAFYWKQDKIAATKHSKG